MCVCPHALYRVKCMSSRFAYLSPIVIDTSIKCVVFSVITYMLTIGLAVQLGVCECMYLGV